MLVRKLHPTYSKWQIRNILHLPHDINLAVIQGEKNRDTFLYAATFKIMYGHKARNRIHHCTNFASFSGGGFCSSFPSSFDFTSVSFCSSDSFLLDVSLLGVDWEVFVDDFFTVSSRLFRAEKSVPTSLVEPLTRKTFMP